MKAPKLQLVRLPRMWIDLFDALNRMLPSVLPCRPWFWIYNQNRPRFRCFLKSSDEEPPTTIKTPSKHVDRPILCAESNALIRFAIAPLGCGDINGNVTNFAVFLKSSDEEPPTTIRTSSKHGDRPI